MRARLKYRAGSLSGGEQQMLALSKAIMLDPEILLIDELSLGLAPLVVQQLLAVIERLKAQGLTMVIVEQSVNVALAVADRRSSWSAAGCASRAPRRTCSSAATCSAPCSSPAKAPDAMSLGLLISEQIVFNGVVLGMLYALLALGVVLIFRASGVINFAQGAFGAFGASVLAVLYVNEGIPFYLTIPLAIISGALFGGLTELFVVRRLFKQPRLLLFIATIGVAQIVLLLQLQLPEVDQPVSFPTPITDYWHIGALTVRGDQLIVLTVVPIVVIVLTFLLQRTNFGLAVRSAADNQNAASLAGIKVQVGVDPGVDHRRCALGDQRAAGAVDPRVQRAGTSPRASVPACCSPR